MCMFRLKVFIEKFLLSCVFAMLMVFYFIFSGWNLTICRKTRKKSLRLAASRQKFVYRCYKMTDTTKIHQMLGLFDMNPIYEHIWFMQTHNLCKWCYGIQIVRKVGFWKGSKSRFNQPLVVTPQTSYSMYTIDRFFSYIFQWSSSYNFSGST